MSLVLLNINKSMVNQRFANNLLSCSCKCLINVPIRITQTSRRLIDHIYINVIYNGDILHSKMVITDISDHFRTFANIFLKPLTKKTLDVTHVRDMKNFNIEIFIEELSKKIKNFSIQNTEAVDSQFAKFMFTLFSVVN